MTKFLILHGTDGSPQSNWLMWLKGRLIGEGNSVWLPQLPNSDKPNTTTYTDFLLSNVDFIFDNDTVIIGHSSGAVEALHLLQHLPEKSMIKGAILVSAFTDNLGWESLDKLFIEPIDFESVKTHCRQFIFIHSDTDPYCPVEQAKQLAEQTDGELVIFEGQGHFNTELGPQYRQFPQILDIIKTIGQEDT